MIKQKADCLERVDIVVKPMKQKCFQFAPRSYKRCCDSDVIWQQIPQPTAAVTGKDQLTSVVSN